MFDACLVAKNGDTVACDAMMRLIERERAHTAAVKKEAAKMLAAGASKRDVVKWVEDNGLVGEDISDAVGISLHDLQYGNY
jgi:predicted aconitase with swiveling domain